MVYTMHIICNIHLQIYVSLVRGSKMALKIRLLVGVYTGKTSGFVLRTSRKERTSRTTRSPHRLPDGVRTNIFLAEVPQYTIIMTLLIMA